MKAFRFQKFDVLQSADVFRVGTDGVLLGAMAEISDANRILEVGTGTGLIALMIAQRNPFAHITAIDVDENAVKLASGNFKNSPFADRLRADYQDYKTMFPTESFDLIVSNPPYFEINSSSKDILARQTVALNFQELISKTAELLSENGIFSVIIPSESASEFVETTGNAGLFLHRNVNIFGIEGGVLKRNILEFSPQPKDLVEEDFTIEKSPRKYSDQYLELTSEFHIFRK